MLKDPKIRWLILAGLLVTIFEILSLIGLRLEPREAIPLFGIITLAIGYLTIWHGIKALFKLNFSNINLLMVIAVAGAFYLGAYEEAAVVIVLFTLAERLEDFGIAKSKSSLDRLVEEMPSYVQIKGMDEPIDIKRVKVGDTIVVKPHHIIPLDGQVVYGQSFVDESTITGEPIPADKRSGDEVFAGTMNRSGVIEVIVKQMPANSTVAKIREMTFTALKHKAQAQQFIERFSSFYTPAVLGLAVLLTFAPLLFSDTNLEENFKQALSLLVIACPCALVISTPIAVYSAIGNASSKGILIKGGRYLEAMGEVKALAFDKTRTLTHGKPAVTDVIPFGGHTREHLLSCAAGIEAFSEHPLAQSIVAAAKKEGLNLHVVEKFESIPGKGTKANCLVCADSHHCVGKLEFILEEHRVPQEVVDKLSALQAQGKTVIVISSHKEVEGLIALEDEIRKEAAGVIKTLLQMGVKSIMLTGDHQITAAAIAQLAGIKQVHAELMPQDKAAEVQKLVQEHGIVGMVGDGVNDAPALAAANVGISMTTLGSDMALEAANIVILNDHLRMIPYLISLGRNALEIIQFNTTFAIAVKLLFVGLALIGMSHLALAIFADVGVTLLVILNSLRLLKFESVK